MVPITQNPTRTAAVSKQAKLTDSSQCRSTRLFVDKLGIRQPNINALTHTYPNPNPEVRGINESFGRSFRTNLSDDHAEPPHHRERASRRNCLLLGAIGYILSPHHLPLTPLSSSVSHDTPCPCAKKWHPPPTLGIGKRPSSSCQVPGYTISRRPPTYHWQYSTACRCLGMQQQPPPQQPPGRQFPSSPRRRHQSHRRPRPHGASLRLQHCPNPRIRRSNSQAPSRKWRKYPCSRRNTTTCPARNRDPGGPFGRGASITGCRRRPKLEKQRRRTVGSHCRPGWDGGGTRATTGFRCRY